MTMMAFLYFHRGDAVHCVLHIFGTVDIHWTQTHSKCFCLCTIHIFPCLRSVFSPHQLIWMCQQLRVTSEKSCRKGHGSCCSTVSNEVCVCVTSFLLEAMPLKPQAGRQTSSGPLSVWRAFFIS